MAGFFDRMMGRSNNKGSGSTAKDRLKMVLVHDRIQIAPEKLREMKAEIVAVIAKYVPSVDPDSVDIALEPTDRYNNKLVAEIPFTQQRNASVDDDIEEDDDETPFTTNDADTVMSSTDDDEDVDDLPLNISKDDATVRVHPKDEAQEDDDSSKS